MNVPISSVTMKRGSGSMERVKYDRRAHSQCYQMELRWRFRDLIKCFKNGNSFNLQFTVILNVFYLKMISLLQKNLQICPKYMTIFFDFGYLCHFTTERCWFFSLSFFYQGKFVGFCQLKWPPINSKFHKKLIQIVFKAQTSIGNQFYFKKVVILTDCI